ncbi:purine-nucleoside phosphorylase [Peptoniphilus sp.]|jgi:purine-nucleoside phosphorylase|uniref:purine-nucleoside phosphorylase n=1 Tax=Peptoniphilus sp. TaxID=1971214 RepID=UPI003D8A1385
MKKTIKYIKSKINVAPEIGIVLGSGLGNFADNIEDRIEISYKDIPNFPVSTVSGHDGKLIFGKINGKDIVAMKGRIHFYEGYDMKDVVFPIKVLAEIGIKYLIITNAAGGVNMDFSAGDLMLITDHINITGRSPLIGPNDDSEGPRFLDMTNCYDNELIAMADDVSSKMGLKLQKGVYMYFTGPNYETAAEIRMARVLGADAVGMSTVPEVIVARHRGIKVLGISTITNMGTGVLDKPLDHSEVVQVGQEVSHKFSKLLTDIVGVM